MRRQRTIIAILALVALGAFAPCVAGASPVLSGYGGPGSGSQAILGSSLSNDEPSSGAGAPSGRVGGASSTAEAAESGGATPGEGRSPRTGAGAGSKSGARAEKARSQATSAGAPAGRSSGPIAQQRPSSIYAALERDASHAGSPSGVSGADLFYILAGAGVLVVAGVMTSRAAHAGRRENS